MPLSLQEVNPHDDDGGVVDDDNDDGVDDDDDDAGGGVDRGGGRGPRQPTQLLRVCPSIHSAVGPLKGTHTNRHDDQPLEDIVDLTLLELSPGLNT